MQGKQVKTLEQLYKLAQQKKAVVVSRGGYNNRTPAAFVLNWGGGILYNLMKYGSIHEYKPVNN